MVRRPAFATREEIRVAAARLFRERGFVGASVREIAAAAGTDPALVIRHFGSKELLFLETMRLSFDDERLRGIPLEALGERLVEMLLDADADTRAVWLALLQASGEPAVAARLRESHEANFVAPLRERLSGPDADGRARMTGALLAGLLYSLWVVDDGGLLAGDRRGLVAQYGGLLQGVLGAEM
jgi:AcrR family transcriptional regulator